MKQLLLFCGVLLTGIQGVYSQSGNKVVAIMPFKYSMPQNKGTASQVQEMVTRIMNAKSDIQTIDRSKDSLVLAELDNQIREVSVAAGSIVAQGKISGATKIIAGTLTQASADVVSGSSGSLQSSGNERYSGLISFSLQLIDVETGTVEKQETFNGNTRKADATGKISKVISIFSKKTGLGNVSDVASNIIMSDTKEEALLTAIKSSEKSVTEWIDGLFPPDIKIVTIESRSNGMPESVVVAGLSPDIKKGTHIIIHEVKLLDIGDGRKAKQLKKIGELRVQELQGGVTLCKVTSGKDVLEDKWKNGSLELLKQ